MPRLSLSLPHITRSAAHEVAARPSLWLGFGMLQFFLVTLYSESWLFSPVNLGTFSGFPSHAIPLFCALLTTTAFAWWYRRSRNWQGAARLWVACTVLACVGAVLCAISMLGGGFGSGADVQALALLITGSICVGPATALATVEICAALGRLGSRTAMLYGAFATLVSIVLISMFHTLPPIGDAAVLIVVPACFMPLLKRASSRFPQASLYSDEGSVPLRIPGKLVATAAIQGFSFGAIYLAFPLDTATWQMFVLDMAGFVLAAAFLIGTVAVARLDYNKLIYLGTFATIAAAYLLVQLAGSAGVVALTIKNAGYAALGITVVGLSAYLVRDLRVPSPWIALVPSVGLLSGQLASVLATYAVQHGVGSAQGFFAIEVFVLLLGAAVLSNMGRRGGSDDWGVAVAGGEPLVHAGIEQSCRVLAERFGLTTRETEVLALLAAGKTKQPIATRLGISVDTAKTHIANTYRKLGIHSQQELIELVERGVR